MRKILFFLLAVFPIFAFAQSEYDLRLERDHYFFDASINGKEVKTIFAETGTFGFTLREKDFKVLFADAKFSDSRLELKKLTSLGQTYKIKHIYYGSFYIGEALYTGNIFVMENKFPEPFMVNVHYLMNDKDTTRNILNISLKEKKMRFVAKSDLDTLSLKHFDIQEFRPRPIASFPVVLYQHGYSFALEGRYYIDMGNPNVITLFDSPKLAAFCKKAEITLTEGIDVRGRKSAMMLCEKCSFGGREFSRLPIAFRNNIQKGLGYVGHAFFQDNLYFDREGMKIYYD